LAQKPEGVHAPVAPQKSFAAHFATVPFGAVHKQATEFGSVVEQGGGCEHLAFSAVDATFVSQKLSSAQRVSSPHWQAFAFFAMPFRLVHTSKGANVVVVVVTVFNVWPSGPM
jgi:hypothetical protein